MRLLLPAEAGAHPHRCHAGRAAGIVQTDDIRSTAEVDQRVLVHPGQHELFQVGLVEHVRLREPVDADLVFAAEFGHHPVPGVEQPQPAAGPGPAQEAVADADPVKRPGYLVVQVDRAGQGVGPGVTFQQGDGYPEVGEQEGRGAADRARADHDDTALHGSGHLGVAVLVVHGDLPLLGMLARWVRYGQVRIVSGNPASASRTRPGSAPVTM